MQRGQPAGADMQRAEQAIHLGCDQQQCVGASRLCGPAASAKQGADTASPFSAPVPELVKVLNQRLSSACGQLGECGVDARGGGQNVPSAKPRGCADASNCDSAVSTQCCQQFSVAPDALERNARSTSCLLVQALTSNSVIQAGDTGPGSAPSGQAASAGSLACPAACCPPPHGVRAVCGKRAKMEDTFSVQTNFVEVTMPNTDSEAVNKLPARIASQVGDQLDPQGSPPNSLPLSPNSTSATAVNSLSSSEHEASVGGSLDSSNCNETLHFFGVYDGHGGVEAAQHCANRLHYHLSSAIAAVAAGHSTTFSADDVVCVRGENGEVQCQAEWNFSRVRRPVDAQAAAAKAFTEDSAESRPPQASKASVIDVSASTTDCDVASNGSSLDASTTSSRGSADSCGAAACASLLEEALRSAFIKTDEEFAADGSSAMVGSTAVVALVGTRRMWIANCGDSRAVLCRNGKAYQVTDDHKPEREDEAERVEKAGGQVLYWNGHRVMGVLAMSRAIGDHGLRPYVIPEPEITVLQRVAEDDFLLLASDGLWDVMSNQEAIMLASRCLARSSERGATREAAVRVAATVLTRAAVDRGSKDNVTVVIIDLRAQQPTSGESKTGTSGTTASVARSGCSTVYEGMCSEGSVTLACGPPPLLVSQETLTRGGPGCCSPITSEPAACTPT